jgi:hypothetical protein
MGEMARKASSTYPRRHTLSLNPVHHSPSPHPDLEDPQAAIYQPSLMNGILTNGERCAFLIVIWFFLSVLPFSWCRLQLYPLFRNSSAL